MLHFQTVNTGTMTSLKALPLELRNEIYNEAIEPLETLDPPDAKMTTILEYFHRLIPLDFQADPQIGNEATTALLRRTLQTVITIRVNTPKYFHPIRGWGIKWECVKHLEFRGTQDTYASCAVKDSAGTEEAEAKNSLMVHDIVTRCPNLESVTFSISHDFMRGPMVPPAKPGESHCTYFFRILEHPNINSILLNCTEEAQNYNVFAPPSPAFKQFVERFQEEARARGREVELKVDLSPGMVSNDCQMWRSNKDGISWLEWHDFFG